MFIMELGGQLGIASSYLSQFASVIGDLSVSTNLGVEDASMQISRFMNIMGTATTDIDRMGASLVGLGNNSATTEADIMEMAMRIAGAGGQIGLSEAQVLGLAASLSSVGIEAQMGGSAISRTMSEIDVAVATGSDALDAWAEAAGMSSQAFAQAWKEDAAAALTQLFAGMEEAVSSGQNINLILQDLGVTELRQTDTLKRLTSASALMGRTMDIANVSWEESVALTNEAEQRYATTESRLLMLKNQYVSIACMHCGSPDCMAVCPAKAISREGQFGAVLVDRAKCIGCRYCSWACEFGAPQFDLDGLMRKCDLCIDRLREGQLPACVESCCGGALTFGPVEEVETNVRARAANRLFRAQ